MKNKLYIAQKALCFDKTHTKILANKYLESKYNPEELNGKYGIPGGKMDFGESPEETLIREVKEETGITIKPILPFRTHTWTYNRNSEKVQIVANSWIALYKSGTIRKPVGETEVDLKKAEWIDLKNIDVDDFIADERDTIENFIRYKKENPFAL